jgi:ATP-dependent DNA ligase
VRRAPRRRHLLQHDPDGVGGNAAALVFFLFDLLYLDGEDVSARPLIERKASLAALLADMDSPLNHGLQRK